jgi:undecaprenyl-diphosphatase
VTPAARVRGLTAAQRRHLGALAIACALAFAALCATTQWHVGFDTEQWVQQRVQAQRRQALERPMRTVSALGSGGVLLGVTAVAGVVLWRRQRPLALAVAAIAIVGYLVADLAKLITIRQRPNTVMWAFPSSHTFGIVIFLGMLAYVLWALDVPALPRRLGVLAAAVIAVGVAYSRLYLNAHWVGDVLGGLTGGAGFVVVGVLVIDRRLRFG